jgi:hypothetical protein
MFSINQDCDVKIAITPEKISNYGIRKIGYHSQLESMRHSSIAEKGFALPRMTERRGRRRDTNYLAQNGFFAFFRFVDDVLSSMSNEFPGPSGIWDSNLGANMRNCWSVLFGKQAAGVFALTMTFFACRYMASSLAPEPVAFQNILEFKEFAASHGLYAHSGNRSNIDRQNYFIADHPVTLDDLDDVQIKLNCGNTPAWRGILWVGQIEIETTLLYPEAISGKWRIWGNVAVAGDESLMNRIEELYQKK